MNMIDALNSAVSAMNAASSVAAINANNTANINTPSFKSRMAVLSEMSRGGVHLSAVRIDNNNGYAIPTGNPKDIAVFGQSTNSNDTYSYADLAGKFRLDDLGNLRSPAGDILFTGAGGNIRLDSEGNLYSQDRLIGQITPSGDNNFTPTGASILSGYMMGSNVDIGREVVSNMINFRYFQFNALTVKTADEMLGTVVNLKG